MYMFMIHGENCYYSDRLDTCCLSLVHYFHMAKCTTPAATYRALLQFISQMDIGSHMHVPYTTGSYKIVGNIPLRLPGS